MLVSDFGEDPEGATPLSEEDYLQLLSPRVRDRDSLNLAEALNILKAQTKHLDSPKPPDAILDDLFVRTLHKEMFGEVWGWAGQYRTRNLNLGSDFTVVSVEVRNLVEDGKAWLLSESQSIDEIACTLHHRLVLIHPFTNGNGRLSRLFADTLLASYGNEPFSWGALSFRAASEARTSYINALRLADKGDSKPLLEFARG